MGIVLSAVAVVIAFMVGFVCGYEECLNVEIIPAHESHDKEGDII